MVNADFGARFANVDIDKHVSVEGIEARWQIGIEGSGIDCTIALIIEYDNGLVFDLLKELVIDLQSYFQKNKINRCNEDFSDSVKGVGNHLVIRHGVA